MSVRRFLWICCVCGVLCVSAASVNVPLLYSDLREKSSPGQLQDFGYLECGDWLVFGCQIKDLASVAGSSSPYLSLYLDIDDDLSTGRYPQELGWDLQFNVHLSRKSLLALTWTSANRSTELRLSRKDYRVELRGDVVYVIVRKGSLGGIALGEHFKFKTTCGPRSNCRVSRSGIGAVLPEVCALPEQD